MSDTLDDSLVLWVERTASPITARAIGMQMVDGDAEEQVAVLLEMADEIGRWKQGQSWPMQCRAIAEAMPPERRIEVLSMIGTLMEHLE